MTWALVATVGHEREIVSELHNERYDTGVGTRSNPPDDATLAQTLGETKNVWDAIVDHIDRLPNGLVRKWKFYGTKYGWQMKVTDGKRAVLYLVPHEGTFLAALALNDKAVSALRSQNISSRLLREITTAKTYREGRPARIEVTSRRDLTVVKKLLGIKLRVHGRSPASITPPTNRGDRSRPRRP